MMTTPDRKKRLRLRIERHRHFFASDRRGDMLVYINREACCPAFHTVSYPIASTHSAVELCKDNMVEFLVDAYLRIYHGLDEARYGIDDDALPSFFTHTGWGTITAAMTGREPVFSDGMAWCHPNMSWEEISALRVNVEHPWIEFARKGVSIWPD